MLYLVRYKNVPHVAVAADNPDAALQKIQAELAIVPLDGVEAIVERETTRVVYTDVKGWELPRGIVGIGDEIVDSKTGAVLGVKPVPIDATIIDLSPDAQSDLSKRLQSESTKL